MDASHYASCLWPGLPELWYRGKWSGLPAAMVFAGSVNFLLIARFVYPEWLQPSLVKIACWVAFGVWIMLVARSASRLPQLLYPRTVASGPDRFPDAHKAYLCGQWCECEAILAEMLEIDARDSQALLMLAAVYRKTSRWEAATATLDVLRRLETADAWWQERELEERRLEGAMKHTSEAQATAPPSPSASGTPSPPDDASILLENAPPPENGTKQAEGDQMSARVA